MNRIETAPRLPLAALLFIALYALAFLLSILGDPLIQSPQLDGAEMVQLARDVDEGSLPPEPFYRSMGYPVLLALLGGEETTDSGFGRRGAVAGILAHLLNAGLVGFIAHAFWRHRASGLVAAALYGIHPVALFFSVQLFDVTWGMTAFLAAVLGLVHLRSSGHGGLALAIGLAGGLAIVFRPHFLFAVPALGLLALVAGRPSGRARWGRVTVFAGLLLPVLAQSVWSWKLSGEWHWLPWQGSYNLFVANTPEANGRYFRQTIVVSGREAAVNPTRAESEARYAAETGEEPPFSVEAMSDHWRERFLAEVAKDPAAWLMLTVRRTFYALHDFEQYNNLSYGYHKERWPLLRWNPLGWGVLFVLATGALIVGGPRRSPLVGAALLAASYAIGLVLFYASARFRLPLAPFLAIAAAGWAVLPWRAGALRSERRRMPALIAMAAAAMLTYAPLFEVRDRSTHVQDALLLGNAAATTGDDVLALARAEEALALDPFRDDARRLALISYWNLRLSEAAGWQNYGGWSQVYERWMAGRDIVSPDPVYAAVLGTFAWHEGRVHLAKALWKDGAAASPENRMNEYLLALMEGETESVPEPIHTKLRELLGIE